MAADIRYLRDEIAIIGWSCRLPGANSIAALWSLLVDGRCAVSQVPPDRFPLQRYGHPRRRERGKSYTWAAGILDDIWGFDPAVFGISPREAEQMDPQQRILLQLTWEALEDANIRPSSLAGSDVGVFIGASQTDYAHAVYGDQAIADSHFATGNALAILANRISYIYDLRGPSVTVDTACSSSLVALHQAVEALRGGRIDTAIVGGINVIGSPAEFISFSQAQMLSPTGLCRAFSANADGYVRSEGGAVLILRRGVEAGVSPVHGTIVASDVNSDGRTSGISLPSEEGQEQLLRRVYARSAIDPSRLAFVEAHGTGTPVGDPIEAAALGHSLGSARATPLPIGSVKSNIGHLEAASGLAGLLKAALALNHGVLPRSLYAEDPNPDIDFNGLNLALCQEAQVLPKSGQRYAGINSFGFGGTNAHVVIAPGKEPVPAAHRKGARSELLALSAASKSGLIALAQKCLNQIETMSENGVAPFAGALAHRRDRLATSLAIATTKRTEATEALHAFVAGTEHPLLSWGDAAGENLPVAFVYSGNGSQWPGMGIAAYRHNPRFRAHFDEIDEYFQKVAGWSLKQALFKKNLAERLALTRIAQPLIFAIQSATTAALRARGLHAAVVLGHSVGEVAAAEAAGILDLRTAVEVIHFRSTHQELVCAAGRMAALLAPPDAVEDLLSRIGGAEIAAFNSPHAITVSGSVAALEQLKKVARAHSIPLLDLDLDYPFHTALMAPVEKPLLRDLKHITPRDGTTPLVSTVTGGCVPGLRLGADYWWRNIREPVQFLAGINAAAALGARYFVEIGPRGTLIKHIADILAEQGLGFAGLSVLERNDPERDPFSAAVAKAWISGARLNTAAVFGPDPGGAIALPSYPWQQERYRYAPSPEAIGVSEPERHPFSGARYSRDGLQWYAHIDTALFPALADHKVGQQIIFPGAGFLEIVLAVAREWLRSSQVFLADLDILKPLDLTNGETREIMSRVSPDTNIIEVFSRPRLSQTGWLLHYRGKVLHSASPTPAPQWRSDAIRRVLPSEQIYRIGDDCGLHYGPAFRLLAQAEVGGDRLIRVTLAPNAPTHEGFVLDPIRIDACAHGLLAVFAELHADERGVSYLPSRFDQAALLVPGGVPHSALIEVVSRNERSIVANYYFYGADNELIAMLRGVRCQAVQVRRAETLEVNAFVETPQPIDGTILGASGVALNGRELLSRMRRLAKRAGKHPGAEEELIEGFATTAAYEIVTGLAVQSVLDVEALLSAGRLPAELGSWLTTLLQHLQGAGLAKRRNGRWTIVKDSRLPASSLVIKELAAKYPRHAAELLLAGAISGLVTEVKKTAAIRAVEQRLPRAALDFYDLTGVALSKGSDLVEQILDHDALWPSDRLLRVLQVGFGPLTQSLRALRRYRDLTLFVVEPDRRRRELAERTLLGGDTSILADAQSVKAQGPFDLIVAVESLHRLPVSLDPARLNEALAPHGLLVALEPEPSLFRDLIFGIDPALSQGTATPYPGGRLQPGNQWKAVLQRRGFAHVHARAIAFDGGHGSFLVAERGSEPAVLTQAAPEAATSSPAAGHTAPHPTPDTVIIFNGTGARQARFGTLLNRLLRQGGMNVTVSPKLDYSHPAPHGLIYLAADEETSKPVAALTAQCLQIKECAERFGSSRARLWLIVRGALPGKQSLVNPIATGIWAFSRTLANEFPHLDVRRIDIAPLTSEKVAAERVRDIVTSATRETELQIDGNQLRAVRADTITRTLDRTRNAEAVPVAARLVRRLTPGARFAWEPIKRTAPSPNEVEIAVEATGLNFRDVMWTLSLLPDEIIDGGVAGATLGCECSGRIVRCGSNVRQLRVGDRVTAFAASAFSTHVTVSAAQVAKLPSKISFQAGATIPVAFMTAYYSLITLAKLTRGEWVLIHGGAGGVGQAAIQVARAVGARVIASAGSPAKRDLLLALGATHVIDSRVTSWVDEVRAVTSGGVDVVLNSLAGEAMERSLACVRPFGRFVELGKRDYVSNTSIGLRPFRNNLSYFGVDIDQILLGRKRIGQKLYADLMRMFAAGTLTPLPHSVFRARDVGQAFELMQRSEHIGKIVVEPPAPPSVRRALEPFRVAAKATHVITGGFGGFGLEAAKWLADKGARHLVLIGRRGVHSEEASAVLAELRRRNVTVHPATCDVADRRAMEALFEHIAATMPPVAGVLHAAMVLDDGLLANLDAKRFNRVLTPKIEGVRNLDELTRGQPLDYFVLFSSATTLMGNPGQANYVAANAYMEGLARRRRQLGQKALAIGWGPITDVGVLAKSEHLQARFKQLTGVRGMRACEALDLMAQALAEPAAPELAVMTISQTEGLFPADRLAVLASPTYAPLSAKGQRDSITVGAFDLRAIAQAEGIEGLRRKLTGVIVSGLARVLRAREEEISRVRPLSDIGLDSLMALEFAMNLEDTFGIHVALTSGVGSLTVSSLANEIIAQVNLDETAAHAMAKTIAEHHVSRAEPRELEILQEIVSDQARSPDKKKGVLS